MRREKNFTKRTSSWMAVLTVGLCLPVDGEESEDKGKELKAYRAARIVVSGGDEVAPGVLLVRGDRVEDVLPADRDLPEKTEVVDLGSAVIYPGLVNPLSAISESSYRSGAGIASRSGSSPSDSRKSVALSRVNPLDTVYRRLGRTGYTSIAIVPSDRGALIAGRASVIKPRRGGETEAKELAVVEKSFLFLGFSSGKAWHDAAVKTLKAAADKIVKEREAKKKAAEAAKKKTAEEAKKKAAEAAKKKAETPKPDVKKPPQPPPTPRPPTPRRPIPGRTPRTPSARPPTTAKPPPPPDPLIQVFKGEVTAVLRVRSPAAMDHLFRFLDSLPEPFHFILVTGSQPPEVVDRLAARKKRIRGVILEPSMGKLWETTIFVNTARLFLEHDFEVAFVPLRDDLEGFRTVFYYLAELVKSGVRPQEAIRGVTTVPAKFLGLEGKVGVLKKDAFANFAVYDRDPLTGTALLQRVYLEGKEIFHDDPSKDILRGEAVR